MKAHRSEAKIESRVLLITLLAACVFATTQSIARAENKPTARAVLRVGFTVDDMDRSIDFYTSVLDFKKTYDRELLGEDVERLFGVFGARLRVVQLQLGDETLELTEYLAAEQRGRPVPRDSRSNDRWFQHVAIVTSDIDRAYAQLRAHHVHHASTGPQHLPDWNKNAAGTRAFYVRDPDDHVLEVIQFPPGKGEPRWQTTPGLFEGIDHTAIVVGDTGQSLAFYRDHLGLKIVGGSENYGTEQAHLNNVHDAHLRITTLAVPGGGPKIELLEYLSPRDGRPYPADARSADIFHWQTTVATDVAQPPPAVSPDDHSRGRLCHMIRDPDGHALLLVPE
jgi:catechol 2,3-dioxygenase-like lactoylglutathione lyase family enzyme